MGRRNKYNLPKGMTFNERSQTYFLITRQNGKKKDIRLGKSYAEAIKAYYEKADFVAERQKSPVTFEDLGHTVLQRKLRVGEIKGSTFEDYSRCFKQLLQAFQGKQITDFTRESLQSYMDCQLHRATRANHELTFLKMLFNYAEDKLLIDANPTRKVEKLPVPKKGFIPSNETIQKFKKACPEWLQLYIDLKMKLGFRQSDMLRLNAGMLDDVGINMVHGKNNFGMRVKYDDELVEILVKIKQLRFGQTTPFRKNWFFFVNQDGTARSSKSFQNAWVRAREKAVKSRLLPRITFTEHDLRAVAAVRTGSLEKAYQLMGHSSIAVTKEFYYREVIDVDAAPLAKQEEVNTEYLNKLGLA